MRLRHGKGLCNETCAARRDLQIWIECGVGEGIARFAGTCSGCSTPGGHLWRL
jgi:hypothetical protein